MEANYPDQSKQVEDRETTKILIPDDHTTEVRDHYLKSKKVNCI